MKERFFEGDVDCPPLPDGGFLAPGYTTLAHLHQSNNFDVYDVFSEERACRCIAKTPRQDLLESERVADRLLREGALLAGLTHPHVARLYEVVEGPPPALILETLTGETLAHLIATNSRRLPIKEVAHLASTSARRSTTCTAGASSTSTSSRRTSSPRGGSRRSWTSASPTPRARRGLAPAPPSTWPPSRSGATR